jgi:protein ImuA
LSAAPSHLGSALSAPRPAPLDLPPAVEAALWRGDQLGSPVSSVISSGHIALDAELPGGGWPCHSLTEVLQAQMSVAEWRLLGPALRSVVQASLEVVVVGPPKSPHIPGLQRIGLDERKLVWLQTQTPAERLWVTEQVIKSNSAGAVVAWLPQARQEQIRRLQICAQACEGLVFLCRPVGAAHEASAAPLRVHLAFGLDWELKVHVVKRKGPTHEGIVTIASMPGGLESVITPRLARPSSLFASRRREAAPFEVVHAVGSAPPIRSGRAVPVL